MLNKGFTLLEMLVSLAILTVISLTIMSTLGTWTAFKQKLDTEVKLSDVRQAFISIYTTNAMQVEAGATRTFLQFQGTGTCTTQENNFILYSSNFSASPQNIARDGYANYWCIYVSESLTAVIDGTPLVYRNIAIVSRGRNGELDTTADPTDGSKTFFDPSKGTLTLGGDDNGVVISGLDVQRVKLSETLARLNKLATMYETYFTSRFLSNSGRDITRYYFSTDEDPLGSVRSTNGTFAPVATSLATLGVSTAEAVSAWGDNIEMDNYNQTVNGYTVKSPFADAANRGRLPYTALLRTKIPSNSTTTPSYISKVVVGNY